MIPATKLDFDVQPAALAKLTRVLALLGSDQPGERAAAALAAHKLVNSLGVTWTELLDPKARKVRPIQTQAVKRDPEWGVDYSSAAESRMRQLKSTNERLEQQLKTMRNRVSAMAERERRARAEAEAALDDDDL